MASFLLLCVAEDERDGTVPFSVWPPPCTLSLMRSAQAWRRAVGNTDGTDTARSESMGNMTEKIKEGIKDTAGAVKRGAEKVKDKTDRAAEKVKDA
jgi:hypothetical protein